MRQEKILSGRFSVQFVRHRNAVTHLKSSNANFSDLLIDHGLVTEAIRYWRGKSEDRVNEFQKLADELEQEIVEAIQTLADTEI